MTLQPARRVSVLGATGSVGTQTLAVLSHLGLTAVCLTGGRNSRLLETQARQFAPRAVALADPSAARDLKVRLADTPVAVLSGPEGVCEAAACEAADTVVAAITGLAGLRPVLAALLPGRRLALANKEALVCAGALVTAAVRAQDCALLPVDSEHSAIFQCLRGEDPQAVERLVLTASGGPFFGMDRDALRRVTPAQALAHPTWRMGPKITVDSATLMNKALECLEATHLFSVPMARIEVAVHRQSVVHSMVVFRDGATVAQLGPPDMRLPIQYALTFPARVPSPLPSPRWADAPALTFAPPDEAAFPALALAREADARGGTAPAVLNGANEAAVSLFLENKIGFLDIAAYAEAALAAVPSGGGSLDDILEADRAARAFVRLRRKSPV
ncbi:MAG: 1-deoxy-D-xylulose-5-phosphate reductoisomerase [Oscillospiraceae bacterium]|jgi:1-deoxy-D-xylulose-5-phosphate reductoisomerase|nr:1-deoxy-D-xylulose-5-phosphate reductoisomerase [Oscillospiraceae bacterium]